MLKYFKKINYIRFNVNLYFITSFFNANKVNIYIIINLYKRFNKNTKKMIFFKNIVLKLKENFINILYFIILLNDSFTF